MDDNIGSMLKASSSSSSFELFGFLFSLAFLVVGSYYIEGHNYSNTLSFFHVNKSCKIACCDNKTYQIIQNMALSQGLELKLIYCERRLSQVTILYFTEGEK